MMNKTRDHYLEAAQLPDYIESESMEKEAIKSVLGMITSKMSDE